MSLYSDKELDEIVLNKESKRRAKQFEYYKINKSLKRNSISASIVATSLGALLGDPTLMYFGAVIYRVQFESS